MSTAPPISHEATRIVVNSKLRRTGVCGAAETLLVDKACAATHLAPLVKALLEAGCAVRGDAATMAVDPRVSEASEADWRTEYLDAILSCRVVDGLEAAIDAYRDLWFAPHRLHRHRGPRRGGAVPQRGRFGDRPAQRFDAIRRRRRIRLRRRDRHRHRAHARARPGRRRATLHVQISRARRRPGAALKRQPRIACAISCRPATPAHALSAPPLRAPAAPLRRSRRSPAPPWAASRSRRRRATLGSAR